ncbi:MAG: ABC transporter substrate-binding protein [Pseudomonadota bacterium]
MTRVALALLSLTVACGAANADARRIVSLDFCADQYVLKLLPRDRVLAVSPDADRHFSYLREAAAGLRQVRPVAEDVLALQPDLIVRSYGGGAHAVSFFERAGVPVVQVPFANDIAGIRESALQIADALGASAAGEALVAEMDRRLERLDQAASAQRDVLYMTPSGVTTGPGTLVHEMLITAGLSNFQTEAGWRSLPLERLAYEQPDLVAASFFSAETNHPAMWSAMRHQVARRQLTDLPVVMLDGAWTACGGWFLLDAIEALADEAD